MKKKIKNQKTKRVLPLALVVVMMMAVFSFGASAQEIKGFEVCDHFMDLTSVMTNDEAWESLENTYDEQSQTSYLFLDCSVCEVRHVVYYYFNYDFQIGAYVIHRPCFCSEQGELYWPDGENDFELDHLGLEYFDSSDEFIDDGESLYGAQPIRKIELISLSSNGSMVGEMTDTVITSFGGLVKGVGASIVNFFEKTVIADDGGLTTLASWTLAFLGIGFGFMVVKFITNKVRKK